MDEKEAAWLAGLIRDASWQLEQGAGLTVEVVGDADHWIQVLPEGNTETGVEGYLLNMPYRGMEGNPLHTLGHVGLSLPPGSEAATWEDDGFATVRIRPDVPLVALAYLINDILLKIMNISEERELSVHIEYGF